MAVCDKALPRPRVTGSRPLTSAGPGLLTPAEPPSRCCGLLAPLRFPAFCHLCLPSCPCGEGGDQVCLPRGGLGRQGSRGWSPCPRGVAQLCPRAVQIEGACAHCRGVCRSVWGGPRRPGCRDEERWKALARGETLLASRHGDASPENTARAAAGPAPAPGLCRAHGVRQDHAATGARRQSSRAPGRKAVLGVSPIPPPATVWLWATCVTSAPPRSHV